MFVQGLDRIVRARISWCAIAATVMLSGCGAGSTIANAPLASGSAPSGPGVVSTSAPATNAPTPAATAPAATPSSSPGASSAPLTTAGLPTLVEPLRNKGVWFVDGSGRAVTFHGLNLANKNPPYTPQAQGFTQQDAQFFANEGFTQVRLGVFWDAVEPSPGVYDDTYLASIKQVVGWLEMYGVTSQLDFQQEDYSHVFGGVGEPDWAADTDGLPQMAIPGGLSGEGVAEPACRRAFDNLWDNTPYPGQIGLADEYGAMWAHVATYFLNVPGISGYDLFNEPNPGDSAEPAFDITLLTPFYKKIVAAIRTVDTVHQLDYEPWVLADAVPQDNVVNGGSDSNLAYVFHFYYLNDTGISTLAPMAAQEFRRQAIANGNAVEFNEFGSTDDFTQIATVIDAADEYLLGWDYWAFWGTEPQGNPATPDLEIARVAEGIVNDPTLPPTGSNLQASKLALLDRPYPYLIAGTPTSWNFDTTTTTFTLAYSTTPVSGSGTIAAPSVVVVPARTYPNGYAVSVTGATVTSQPGAESLTLQTLPGATTVTLTISLPAASASSSERRLRANHR